MIRSISHSCILVSSWYISQHLHINDRLSNKGTTQSSKVQQVQLLTKCESTASHVQHLDEHWYSAAMFSKDASQPAAHEKGATWGVVCTNHTHEACMSVDTFAGEGMRCWPGRLLKFEMSSRASVPIMP